MWNRLKGLDWTDIALHGFFAYGVMDVGYILGVPGFAAFAATLFAIGRETIQQRDKDKPLSPSGWSLQKHLEWLVVPLVCVVDYFSLLSYVSRGV